MATDPSNPAKSDDLQTLLSAPVAHFPAQQYFTGSNLLTHPFGRIEGNQAVIQPDRELQENEAMMQFADPGGNGHIYKQEPREAVQDGIILDGAGKAWKGVLWRSRTQPRNGGVARLWRRGWGYRGAGTGFDCLGEQYVLRERETVFGCTVGELLRNHWDDGGGTDMTRRASIYDQNQIGVWVCHEATTPSRPMNDIVYEDVHWHKNMICNIAICGVNPDDIPVSVRLVGGGSEYSTWNQKEDATLSRVPTDNHDPLLPPRTITAKRAGFYLQGGELIFDNFTFNDADAFRIIRLDGPASVVLKDSGGGGTQGVKLVSRENRAGQCTIQGRFFCVGGVEGAQRWPDIWARRIIANAYDQMNYSYIIGAPTLQRALSSHNKAASILRGPRPMMYPEKGATVEYNGRTTVALENGANVKTPWLEGGHYPARWSMSGIFPVFHGFCIESPEDCVVEMRFADNAWPVIEIPLFANEEQRFAYTAPGVNYDNFMRFSVRGGGMIMLREFQSWHGSYVEYKNAITALMNGEL